MSGTPLLGSYCSTHVAPQSRRLLLAFSSYDEKDLDNLHLTIGALLGVCLMFVLFWTYRAIRRLPAGETAKISARQYLWSCIFFSMLSLSFGFAVSGMIRYSTDFLRIFSAIWFGALTCVGIYPVVRDTKRLADTAAPSQINSVR